MIPHKQLVKHDPPNSYGDCLRTAVACILNIEPLTEVPHFNHDGASEDVTYKRLVAWCETRNLAPFYSFYDGANPLETVLDFMKRTNPNIDYLLLGMSQSGPHVVVCRDDKIVHNTAWVEQLRPIVGPIGDLWTILTFVVLCK